MSTSGRFYGSLPADERQEFRLPTLLKEHLSRVAAHSGQSLAEYITAVLAERVSADLAALSEWHLTVDEQTALMKLLVATPTPPSPRALNAAERADALFGPIASARTSK